MSQSRKEAEVWAACDRLTARGDKLTYRAIGDCLEEMNCRRGSNSDLFRYLTTWRLKQGQTNAATPGASLSPQQVKAIQEAAVSQAQETIEALKEKHEAELAAKEAAFAKRQAESQAGVSVDLLVEGAEASQKITPEALVSLAFGEGSPLFKALDAAIQSVEASQERRYLGLFEHHQKQFDQYMSALEHLRSANNLLSNQMASLRATQAAHLQERDREIAQLKDELSRERKRRMHLERQQSSQRSTKEDF